MNPTPIPEKGHAFATTRWSIVQAAGDKTAPDASRALEQLCEIYWMPVYSYIRRSGRAREEAEDLTQAFFSRLIEKQDIGGAERRLGRFRSYLVGALKHFLINEFHKENSARRGGGRQILSLDFDTAEEAFRIEASSERSPDREFERRWANTLLEMVIAQLRAEYAARGRADMFDRLKDAITDDHIPLKECATQLGISESAAKVAAHRLRKRYGDLVRRTIADTVADPADVDDEIRFLLDAL